MLLKIEQIRQQIRFRQANVWFWNIQSLRKSGWPSLKENPWQLQIVQWEPMKRRVGLLPPLPPPKPKRQPLVSRYTKLTVNQEIIQELEDELRRRSYA